MSAAHKVLFSGPDGSANISGLIEALKGSSPGALSRLRESGGRLNGEAQVTDFKCDTSANASRITEQKKL